MLWFPFTKDYSFLLIYFSHPYCLSITSTSVRVAVHGSPLKEGSAYKIELPSTFYIMTISSTKRRYLLVYLFQLSRNFRHVGMVYVNYQICNIIAIVINTFHYDYGRLFHWNKKKTNRHPLQTLFVQKPYYRFGVSLQLKILSHSLSPRLTSPLQYKSLVLALLLFHSIWVRALSQSLPQPARHANAVIRKRTSISMQNPT